MLAARVATRAGLALVVVASLAAQMEDLQLVAVQLGSGAARTAAIALGDVDGDGDLDAVVAAGRHWPEQNRVFFNDGGGHFRRARRLGDQPDRSYAVPLADLDGDGDLDVVVGNDRGVNLVFWNDGRGEFRQGPSVGAPGRNTRSITLADLNGDSRIDIVVANRGEPNTVHLNDGHGAFTDAGFVGSGIDDTIATVAADFDGDGDLDLALACRGTLSTTHRNDGSGRFDAGRPIGTEQDNTAQLAAGDLDDDGHVDLVATNGGQRNMLLLGRGDGTFADAIRFGAESDQSYGVALGDLDQDGDLDIVVGNQDTTDAIYFNDGDLRALRELRFGEPDQVTYGVTVGDVSGDGVPDILAARSGGPNVVYVSRLRQTLPPPATHYKGREIAQTMHWQGAEWLMRATREQEENAALLLRALGVRPGQVVCDLGCGNGFHSLQLAQMVGPTGRILAVDIQRQMLAMLARRASRAGITNVERILGTVADPKLPPASCDLILLVDVYHEISYPELVLGRLHRALRPGGRLVLVEFRAEDPAVPIKEEHKMSKQQILAEIPPNGFDLVEEFDELPWQHVMFFVRAEGK